jgi:protein required for attachment to host cells
MTYDIRQPPPASAAREWVLLANAARARLFERDAENGAMRELESFVHPLGRAKGAELASDRAGQAMKGQARTEYAPHTEPHQREQQRFAQELAQYVEQAALAHRFDAFVAMASDPFLGYVRAELGRALHGLPHRHVARDFTPWQGAELEHRVTEALGAREEA